MTELTPEGIAFVTEYHLASLSTIGPDGRIHVVPVGFTYRDGLARVITSGPSQKVANLRRDARATLSQVDGRHWLTLAGTARILDRVRMLGRVSIFGRPLEHFDAEAKREWPPMRQKPVRVPHSARQACPTSAVPRLTLTD